MGQLRHLLMRTAWILCPLCTLSAEETLSRYQQAARAYADHMIQRARDHYGQKQSPLFASALHRTTNKIGTFPKIDGVREHDRSTTGSNPYHNTELYLLLYALTQHLNEPKYAAEAERALQTFLVVGQSPKTGLLAWGEHAFVDFNSDTVGGRAIHELDGPWPLMDVFYDANQEATQLFVIGLWEHQVADQETGDFSRHTNWHKHGPGKGAEFPRYAGQMIEIWAEAYARPANRTWEKRPDMLIAIDRILARMEQNHQTTSGHLLAGTDKNHRRISWPGSNLELARCLWKSADMVPAVLAKRMRHIALKLDQQFLSLPHTITPKDGGFIATIDIETGKPRSRGTNKPLSTGWETGYGFGTHAQLANRCLARYQQLNNKQHRGLKTAYAQLIRHTADYYKSVNPPEGAFLKPEIFANVGNLLLEAATITGDVSYEKRAYEIADMALQAFIDGSSPLPKASTRHHHYEAITGGPALMYFLFQLE